MRFGNRLGDEQWIALGLFAVAVFAAYLSLSYTSTGVLRSDGVTVITRLAFGIGAVYLGASAYRLLSARE